MSRTRRIITSCLPGRRRPAGEEGLSLIEVLVALSLLITVMATTAGFFTTSLKQSNGQTQAQEAAVLADQQLDYTRSVAATSLLAGRTQAAVQAQIASPGRADLSQDVTTSGNYDTAVPPSSSMSVPIKMTTTVSGTAYTVVTFIDQCYVSVAANQTCTKTDSGNGWVYRITVDVSYSLAGGRACGSSSCQFVASTLRDPGTDPCFNVNVDYAGCSTSQPTIVSFNPNTVTTGSTHTIVMTGTNFDAGATVSIDNGGTVSSVTGISSSSLSFTLTTDNTPAAVGTSTIKVTNPNGKFAYGTLTITTTAMNVNTVTPSPIYTGSTNTLTISGSGFQSGSVVSIPTTAGTIVGTPTITANTITLSFTTGATSTGTWAATVTNPDGASDTANFVVQKAPVTLTGISPSTMAWGTTRNFTLTGTGFNSGAQVTLDGANVNETWISSTSMTVALTSDPSVATHTFTVTNPDGGTASKTFSVTVNGITVTAVSPATMVWGNTRSFTITGTNFLPAAQVTLDGAGVNETWVNSTTMTVALTSDPATGTHTFAVVNPDGGTASKTFVVTQTISDVNPDTVTHGSNLTFTITGHFTGTTGSVILTGTLATTVTATTVNSTSVTFKMSPSTAKTYTEGVQFKASDGTTSNVYSWSLKAN